MGAYESTPTKNNGRFGFTRIHGNPPNSYLKVNPCNPTQRTKISSIFRTQCHFNINKEAKQGFILCLLSSQNPKIIILTMFK